MRDQLSWRSNGHAYNRHRENVGAHVQSMDHPKDADCRVILVDNGKGSAVVTKSAPNTDTEPSPTVFDERTKTDENDRTIDLPLVADDDSEQDGGQIRLACALVGQGGRIRGGKGNRKPYTKGSKIAIFVSVGHQISLHAAVQICAWLSLARIPEPVRQADFIGRSLLPRRK
jgi:hypothetical protein